MRNAGEYGKIIFHVRKYQNDKNRCTKCGIQIIGWGEGKYDIKWGVKQV